MATPTSTHPAMPVAGPPAVSRRPRPLVRARDSMAPAALAAPAARSLAVTGLRLALGLEFLWAVLDKTFGLGYATPSAKAWINGGSPTTGFLSGVSAGPLSAVFNSMAGSPVADWLFMLGLLGIGTALLLGVALRAAAVCGVALLVMMWLATWPPATIAAGQPSGSTNPLIDDHIISALALMVVASLATANTGVLGRWWSHRESVRRWPWLR